MEPARETQVTDGVSYDIEISPACGNYDDVDEYCKEVDGFLRYLFRIDRTDKDYSPLEYTSHITLPDIGGETIVMLKFSLSTKGRQNGVTFESAVQDFCNRVFHQKSGEFIRYLTAAERLGLSPVSTIFRQYWLKALYSGYAKLGPEFFITLLQTNTNRQRWPRWATTVYFIFLSGLQAVRSEATLGAMADTGVDPLRSWAQNDSNQLTLASNTAASFLRGRISNILSAPEEEQNRLFGLEVRCYQSKIHSIFTELERLGNHNFMARETVDVSNDLYSAIETSCVIFTANEEMCDMFFKAQCIDGAFEVGNAAGIGYAANQVYNSVQITRAVAGRATAFRVLTWPGLAAGTVLAGFSAVGYYYARSGRLKATAAKASHKEINLHIRSSLNICFDVLRALRLLQHRAQILGDLETWTRPFTIEQDWWIEKVNRGEGTSFDMAKVRSYLLIQKGHLQVNHSKIERLVNTHALVPA